MTTPDPSILRSLDASLNRAREGLRVVEDYARFTLNHAGASGAAKRLRNQLASLAHTIEVRFEHDALLRSRDTPGDVGTAISTPAERQRKDGRDLASANLKRVQEALRSIEEHLKALGMANAAKLAEACRYQSYSLERMILLPEHVGSQRRRVLADTNVMLLVSADGCAQGVERVICDALDAGVRCLQLREKSGDDRQRFARLQQQVELIRGHESRGSDQKPLILINDRADFAAALDADGVHLGQDDLPPDSARKLLGQDALIGLSTHNADELRAAEREGIADYCGAGAMFATSTKQVQHQGGPAWGEEATRMAALPVFCIGGITSQNLAELTSLGVTRVALSSAICAAADPARAARELLGQMAGANLERS